MTARNRTDEVDACNEAGRLCLERGDLQGASVQFQRALELLREDPDPKREAVLRNNLGHVQVVLGRLDDALDTFREAARLCERIGDRAGLGWQWANVGSVCRDKQDHDAALTGYRQALSVFEEQGDAVGMADQYGNIGYIHAMKQERDAALGWFGKAKALYQAQGEERKAALVGKNIEILSAPEDP